jgi:hypothetical protein
VINRKYIIILVALSLLLSLYTASASALVCSGGANCTHCNLFGMNHTSLPSQPTPAKNCCSTTKSIPCDLETPDIPNQSFLFLPQALETETISFSNTEGALNADTALSTVSVFGIPSIVRHNFRSPPIFLQTLSLRF